LEFKRRMAQTACGPQVSVSKLAAANGLNANQLFRWRRQYREGHFGPMQDASVVAAPEAGEQFHVVTLSEQELQASAPDQHRQEIRAAGVMRLRLPRGELTIEGSPDRETLEVVLRCLAR
jgi:transposase